MKGLELARKYWEELGRPAFEKVCPQVMEKACVGLVEAFVSFTIAHQRRVLERQCLGEPVRRAPASAD